MYSAMQSTHPKGLEKYLGKAFIHYLIVACNKANCPRIWPWLLSQDNHFYRPFDDPAEAEGTGKKNSTFSDVSATRSETNLLNGFKEH